MKNNRPVIITLIIVGGVVTIVVLSLMFRACVAIFSSSSEPQTQVTQETPEEAQEEPSGTTSRLVESQTKEPEKESSEETTVEDDEWVETLQEEVQADAEEDPYIKDLGDGRYAIQSHWRGVQIKYPSSYYANEDWDALYVYDGDAMYVYARNITKAAEDYNGDLTTFCLAKAEEQAVADFTKLFGAPTNTDGVSREGGDGKSRMAVISGNMWNGNADMHFKSKVVISGKQNNFLVMYTAFWRYGDDVSKSHYDKIKVTSWGKGDMYE